MNDRVARVERFFEIPVLIAALLVIPVIVIEQSSWGEPWKTIGSALNWAIWIAFLVELVAMLWVVPNRGRWALAHPLEIAIVVLTPPFLPSSLQALRIFRLFRVLRLARLLTVVRRLNSVQGLRFAAVIAALTALGGGAAFAAVEDKSTWIGVYWAVATMTTVGYGDVSPHTDLGRGIAIAVMLVGVGFAALVIGAIAQRFIEPSVEDVREGVEEGGDTVETVVAELRSVTARLRELETRVQRLGEASPREA